MGVQAAHFSKIGAAPDIIPGVSRCQQVRHFRGRQNFMPQAFQHGQIFRPALCGTVGHDHFFVPAQNTDGVIEGRQAGKMAL